MGRNSTRTAVLSACSLVLGVWLVRRAISYIQEINRIREIRARAAMIRHSGSRGFRPSAVIVPGEIITAAGWNQAGDVAANLRRIREVIGEDTGISVSITTAEAFEDLQREMMGNEPR